MAAVDWVNSDGLIVRFGPNQGIRGARAGVTMGAGKHRELVLTVDLAGPAGTRYTADLNNDGVNEAFAPANGSGLDTPIPAGAVITSQRVRTLVAPAGGTSFTIGTYLANGTADNATGIRTAAGTDGAQVGTQLAAARFAGVTTTGVYTAGRIQVVVSYLY
jgi:hypothetical protein